MQKTVSVQLLQKEERKKNCCVATRCDASKRFVESNRNVISHARIQFSLSLPCLSLFLSLSFTYTIEQTRTFFFLLLSHTHTFPVSLTLAHTRILTRSLSPSPYPSISMTQLCNANRWEPQLFISSIKTLFCTLNASIILQKI